MKMYQLSIVILTTHAIFYLCPSQPPAPWLVISRIFYPSSFPVKNGPSQTLPRSRDAFSRDRDQPDHLLGQFERRNAWNDVVLYLFPGVTESPGNKQTGMDFLTCRLGRYFISIFLAECLYRDARGPNFGGNDRTSAYGFFFLFFL